VRQVINAGNGTNWVPGREAAGLAVQSSVAKGDPIKSIPRRFVKTPQRALIAIAATSPGGCTALTGTRWRVTQGSRPSVCGSREGDKPDRWTPSRPHTRCTRKRYFSTRVTAHSCPFRGFGNLANTRICANLRSAGRPVVADLPARACPIRRPAVPAGRFGQQQRPLHPVRYPGGYRWRFRPRWYKQRYKRRKASA